MIFAISLGFLHGGVELEAERSARGDELDCEILRRFNCWVVWWAWLQLLVSHGDAVYCLIILQHHSPFMPTPTSIKIRARLTDTFWTLDYITVTLRARPDHFQFFGAAKSVATEPKGIRTTIFQMRGYYRHAVP